MIDKIRNLVDDVLIRDSCGTSMQKVQNYVYYNEYSSSDFEYTSNYGGLHLLDVIEGNKGKLSYLHQMVPYLIIIAFGLVSWIIWIIMCCCFDRPQCCFKRNKEPKRIMFCFWTFLCGGVVSLVLIIVSIVYVTYAKTDLNSTLCAILMFQYDVLYGQGLLGKDKFYKPYFYGTIKLDEIINGINSLLTKIDSVDCDAISQYSYSETIGSTTYTDIKDVLDHEIDVLNNEIYSGTETVPPCNPTNDPSLGNDIVPLYMNKIGPSYDESSYIWKLKAYIKDNYYSYVNDFNNLKQKCVDFSSLSPSGLINSLNKFKNVLEILNQSNMQLQLKVTDYLSKYSDIYKVYIFGFNFFLLIFILVLFIILSLLILFFNNRPYSVMLGCVKVFFHVVNILLMISVLFTGITGISYLVMSNFSDIVDLSYSEENLESSNPRVIFSSDYNKYFKTCLRGSGGLFMEIINENSGDDAESLISVLSDMFRMHTKIKAELSSLGSNTFSKGKEIVSELTKYKDDIILTTDYETHGKFDIQTIFDELNLYTVKSDGYQYDCINHPATSYGFWTTVETRCPSKLTYSCYLFKDYTAPDAGLLFDGACSYKIGVNPTFSSPKIAVENYIQALNNYEVESNCLLGSKIDKFNDIINDFEGQSTGPKIITSLRDMTERLNTLTSDVYHFFSPLINDTALDTELLLNLNLFSFLNCSFIGQDYNMTLSLFKSGLTKDLRIVTFVSLFADLSLYVLLFLLIALINSLRDDEFVKEYQAVVNETPFSVNKIDRQIKEEIGPNLEEMMRKLKEKREQSRIEVVEDLDKKNGVNLRRKVDNKGMTVVHPVRVGINNKVGIMEAAKETNVKYTFDTYPNGNFLPETGERCHDLRNLNDDFSDKGNFRAKDRMYESGPKLEVYAEGKKYMFNKADDKINPKESNNNIPLIKNNISSSKSNNILKNNFSSKSNNLLGLKLSSSKSNKNLKQSASKSSLKSLTKKKGLTKSVTFHNLSKESLEKVPEKKKLPTIRSMRDKEEIEDNFDSESFESGVSGVTTKTKKTKKSYKSKV